jgi:aspartate/methionine/tyrosine aminotransferase
MRKIVYMEWVKTRPRARYEIGASGVIPVHIKELPEARDALQINDFNLYGYRPLIRALADRYQVSPDQVITAPGTSMANYLAIAATVGAGEEVLVEKPAYEPLLDIPELIGAKVRRFERRFHNDRFHIDMQSLTDQMTPRTRLIVLTNPHNPSGILESPEVLREVGRLAADVGAYVLVDEVYMDFLFQSRPRTAVHLGSNFLMTCSLTKVYGLDGLRCGWVLGPPDVVKAMWRLQDFFGVNGVIPGETTSVVAFKHLERFQKRTQSILAANRPLMDQFMAAHQSTLDWAPPDAGPVCFPRLRSGSADDFCARLCTEYDVSVIVIPGRFFEMPDHFRIGFGGPTEDLRAGLERLSQALL